MTGSDLLTRGGGSFDAVIAPGESEATTHLRTEELVRIGGWQAVAWEVLPDGRDGDHVEFSIKVSRIAHPQFEVVLFQGEGNASVGSQSVECPIPPGAPVVVTVQLPAPRGLATNVRLHLWPQ